MMNKILFMAFVVVIFSSQPSIAEFATDDAIVGVWLTGERDGYIKIYKNDDTIEGLVFRSLKPEDVNRVDVNNPDPKMRNQSLLGLVIMKGFNFDGVNRWTGGQLYDPNTGNTYQGNLELIDGDQLALRGYVGIPLFGRTENWTRHN